MDRFVFYHNSRDAPPCGGAREICQSGRSYEELQRIPNWRRVLSTYHVHPFKYNGQTYRTIEHAYQGSKAGSMESHFTIESGHRIGLGDGSVAHAEQKWSMLSEEETKKWNENKDMIMSRITRAKYEQCELARKVLKLTYPAELWLLVPRSKNSIHLEYLEELRASYLRDNQDEDDDNVKRVRQETTSTNENTRANENNMGANENNMSVHGYPSDRDRD